MYWVKEYLLVLFAYCFVMFAWPEIVFRKYLRGRSLTMRICFDSLFMILATNLLVLGLGLCHILNPWVVRIAFWGGLAASLIIPFVQVNGAYTLKRFGALLTGGYGIKSFGSDVAKNTGSAVDKTRGAVNGRLANHVILYALLVVATIYGMIYFSVGVFQSTSYGFGDMYTHHKWIYALVEGKIFGSGIYPEGMHTFVYLIHTCFGVDVYSILLFLQPIHVALFFLAIFMLCKEIFNWRYTGIIVLTLFLTVEQGTVNGIYAFSRLQWTLPLEFGAFAAILCPVFLLRYLKEAKENKEEFQIKRVIRDENILLFAMALFVTIAVHFYCTIIAFFLCLAIVPLYLKQVFNWKHFVTLLATVVLSTVLSTAPMLLALAQGISFQGSIGWGLDVINGTTSVDGTHVSPTPTPEGGGAISIPESGTSNSEAGFSSKIVEMIKSIPERYIHYCYGNTFDKDFTNIYILASAIAIVSILLLGLIIIIIKARRKKKGLEDKKFLNISSLIAAVLMLLNLMIMSYPRIIGLPQLVSESRLCYFVTLLNMMVLVIPLDIVLGRINLLLKDRGDGLIAIAVTAATVVLVLVTDSYHGTPFIEYTRYNSAVDTTVKIMAENRNYSYSIVSAGTELWQVSEEGRYVEGYDFVNGIIKDSYTIPTEKVYIFIEKHPIQYAQRHFPYVASWLADNEKNQQIYDFTGLVSTGENIVLKYELDMEFAGKMRTGIAADNKTYTKKDNRIKLESRLMNWVQSFEKLYPRTLKVFYEDEDFICYYFEQNTFALYELAIQDPLIIIGPDGEVIE